MFVKAPVINRETNEKGTAKFMVDFYHTPYKKGKHRRKCICRIYACSAEDVETVQNNYPYNNVSSIETNKHPETKSRMLLVEAEAQCETKDNYVKAYGRMLSLQRGLRYLIDNYYNSDSVTGICSENPFVFTNETYKAFTHQLNNECGSGKQVAWKLQHTDGYNPFDVIEH
mgnify:CR=1 FL=1